MAIVIGGLYAAGLYMMMRRSMVKLAIGIGLLGNAANLLIFSAANLTRGKPPFLPLDGSASTASVADPVPQALILTAIVIGFGVLAFLLVLLSRTYKVVGTDDLDEIKSPEL